MKKRLFPFILIIPALLVLTYAVSDKLVLAFHIARLYAAEPDSQLAMPVAGVSKSHISNTWHAPRTGDRLHEGQDIFAPRGTPVLSATAGYIARIGENKLGGQTVSVIGAGGRVYYYAHLDSYAPGIATGDRVTTETVLGYVGNTGNAAGAPPHLHFGVYSRRSLDPLPLLSDRPEAKLGSKESSKTGKKQKR